MPLSDKFIRNIAEKNRKYLDALEAADKKGGRPVLRKVRKNFTVDENTFLEFHGKCHREKKSMSSVLEEFMEQYVNQ